MKKVAIIGAGLSGLTTAKSFLEEKGYDVTVFEKGSSLGGVWAKDKSYPGVRTQTTRDEYSFSDFKMPSEYPEWPTGQQVLDYLTYYAMSFGVHEKIKFNTEVAGLRRKDNLWEIDTNTKGKKDTEEFHFVVICSGTFHLPSIPEYPGREAFEAAGGVVLHSSQLKDPEQLKGKNIAVVGFAKSATDIATLAVNNAKSVTLVFRKAQWKVPRFFGNLINMKFLLFSRFSETFFDYHNKSFFEKILHSIGRPLVWMQWRGLEALLKFQFKLKKNNMVPEHKIEDQISCSLGVEPENFYEYIGSKKITAIKSSVQSYENDGLKLANGEKVRADMVIFGTGFSQKIPYLEEKFQHVLKDEYGKYRLYRNILNPDIPDLAFVGFNSSLFTTLTSEVASKWVVSYVNGELSMPSRQKMLESIEAIGQWRMKTRPIAGEFGATCIAPFNFHHLDELMLDMGLKTKKTNNIFWEMVKPINPADYKTLLDYRMVLKQKRG